MPRGASKDVAVTKLLRQNGLLLDPRSFVALPRKDDKTVHLFLEGPDKAMQRPRIFRKRKFKCSVCRHLLSEPDDSPIDVRAEWHHTRNCDCIGCSEIRCSPLTGRDCHAHRTPGFRRTAKEMRAAKSGAKDFTKLYGEAT